MNRVHPERLFWVAALTAALVVTARQVQGQRTTPRSAAELNPATISIQPLPSSALALRGELSPLLRPTVRNWVQTEARAIAQQDDIPDVVLGKLRRDVVSRFAGQQMSEPDIMAMTFIVLMQATEAADADLKAIMAQMKRSNDNKKTAREAGTSIQTEVDSLRGSEERQRLNLQSVMQRRSKMLELVSNLLKKASAASRGIIGNLK